MRITGGRFRSRLLAAPPGRATRPTSDRTREGLFGILSAAGAVEAARVLDLYAGTGSLGLEALSRGAAHVAFVESSRDALRALRQNVDALGVADCTTIIAGDLAGSRTRAAVLAAGPFHLVMADPPWDLVDDGDVAQRLGSLVAAAVLHEGGTLVLERSSRSATPSIEGAFHVEDRRYGDATLAFYKTAILGRPRAHT
ncbi:MAG: 16S rRNA (guanine(966)-N(2))-methyltransferase RsmD [Polyangiaceae bacterium]